MNVIMAEGGGLIEIQGTAEKAPFPQSQLTELVDLAATGIEKIIQYQQQAVGFK